VGKECHVASGRIGGQNGQVSVHSRCNSAFVIRDLEPERGRGSQHGENVSIGESGKRELMVFLGDVVIGQKPGIGAENQFTAQPVKLGNDCA
jgi:hypothetical protein